MEETPGRASLEKLGCQTPPQLHAGGVGRQQHENNDYLTEMSRFLRDNSLLISAPKSTVTLFTPHPKQIHSSHLILIAYKWPTESVKEIMSWKALAGTNWGQQKETLLLTYKTLGRSIANYAAPVWNTNACDPAWERYNALRMKH